MTFLIFPERIITFPLWTKEIARQFIYGERAEIVKKYGKQNDDTLMLNGSGNVFDEVDLRG